MRRRAPKLVRRLVSLSGSCSNPPLAYSTNEISAKTFSTTVEVAASSHPLRRRGRSNCGDITPVPRFRSDAVGLLPRSAALPDAESICRLLSEPSNHKQAIDFLLREHRHSLTSELVLHVLCNYRDLGRARTLEFFSWAGFHLRFRFDDAVVEYMADFLGRRKLFDDLKCLLRTVSSSKGRVSTRAFSICIRFLGRQGRVAEVLSLFEAMESEFNCAPDNLVFNNVLYVLCRMSPSDDSMEIALAVFRRIRSPDAYSYSNVVVGLCKSGRVEHALKMFEEMTWARLAPTRTAANALIGRLCELGVQSEAVETVPVRSVRRPFDILVPNVGAKNGMNPVVEVFWAVWKLGLLPSAFVVERLISDLCHLGKVEEAVDILKAVGDGKPRSFEESYTIVVTALCRVRQMEDACNLFERMLSLGLKPRVAVYNAIICALCKMGSLRGAEEYFKIMSKMRCEPDSATYTVLIHAYCGVQNWKAAYGLLIEMIGVDLCPHFGTHSLVDSFLKANGRTDLAVTLEAKMEAQILRRHCRAGKLEAAYEKLRTIIEKGIHPPIYMIDTLKQTFRGSSKWKMVKELLDKLDQVSPQNLSET